MGGAFHTFFSIILIVGLAHAEAKSSSPPIFFPKQFADIETAVGGQIPFPPEKFAESLLALDGGSTLNAAILPHGRSLERFYTDEQNPRTVMVWSNQGRPAYRIYFAYTPRVDELEVIAWNWQLRQYDFKLVHDYGPGKTPRVTNPPRGLCVACHQGGGPLFPEFPWSETVNADGTFDHFVGKDVLSKYIMGITANSNSLANLTERFQVQNVLVDLQVRNGNLFLQKQNVCENACGGDLDCRAGLLLSALNQNAAFGAYTIPDDSWRAKMSHAMHLVWPKDNFAYLSDSLSDRAMGAGDPLKFSDYQDPLRRHITINQLDVDEGSTASLMTDYALCWNFSSEQIHQLNSWGHVKVEAAMKTAQIRTLVKTWLPSEEAIFSAITAALKSPQKPQSPSQVPWSAPVENSAAISDPLRPKQTTLALLDKYCARCHAEPSTLAQELPLSDLHELKNYVGTAGRTPEELLDPKLPLMPPIGLPQPTIEERQQILDDLRRPR